MRVLLATLFFAIQFVYAVSQNVPTRLAYEGLLWAENDTFYVNAVNWDNPFAFPTTEEDTVDLGTDGFPGQCIQVWTTSDTLSVPYVNAPYEQWLYITVGSPKDTTVYRLRFNEQGSSYPDDYVREHKGKIDFRIPETYELANIVLYLSDCSEKTFNHPYNTNYTAAVVQHFAPFKNHILIQTLNNKCKSGNYWQVYYDFRENSICFRFNNDVLNFDTPYKNVWWSDTEILGGSFRNLLYLVQDFAQKSGFRKFYAAHKNYYESLEKRQAELLPVTQMWKWLESEFPQRKDAYTVIFSPLIGGSHSTQQFYRGPFDAPDFSECVMFINAPEDLDAQKEYSEALKAGLMSGIVFTEIDHNYVNPTSEKFIREIKSLLADKNFWATPEAQKNYPNEFAIFNEYMTHALFCLYIKESYAEDLAKRIIEKRVELMDKRGYPKFKAFNEILLRLAQNRKETIYQMYGPIMEEMKKIK